MSTPSAPKPADSVGVAMPRMISPITQNTTKPIGRTLIIRASSTRPKDVDSTTYSGAASLSIFTWA